MTVERTRVRIKGKDFDVPSAKVGGCTITVNGGWLKNSGIFDEELLEQGDRPDPISLIDGVGRSALRADILSFGRAYWQCDIKLEFQAEPDNMAVAAVDSFDTWWKGLPQATRRNVRLSEKRGVEVRPVGFDDLLVMGIKKIYDETPVRQGRHFWHFQKDLRKVREENATYLTRSQFIGAYLKDELIGFIKFIRVDQTAILSQILAMEAYRDHKAANALVKCAVELCQQQGLTNLVYGKFDYGGGTDNSLSEFKRRNGFAERGFPRYVVPLSAKGRLAVRTGLHRGLRAMVPAPLAGAFRAARQRVVTVTQGHSK